MSKTLRSLLALSVVALVVGCSQEPAPSPAVEAPPAVIEAAPTPAPVVEEAGGYTPSASELVPGITSDQAQAQPAEVTEAAADVAPTETPSETPAAE